MGLNITYYSKLTPCEPHAYDANACYGIHFHVYANPDFPKHADGLAGCYLHEGECGFRAGSYSGYNEWRNELALFAYGVPAEDVWRDDTEGPFFELINFSDAEGTIGPVTSAKLAQDFAAWQERANAANTSDWWLTLYGKWRRAFETAANGGCVDFH